MDFTNEDIWDLAEAHAWTELGGAHAPELTWLDSPDGCWVLLAERHDNGDTVAACKVGVTVVSGDLTPKTLAVYTHGAGVLHGEREDNPYHPDEATALAWAVAQSWKERAELFEVWTIDGDRIALVFDADTWRKA